MAEPVLSCRNVRKAFGARVAVDGVGFSIAEGECYGLLGPNGAGKTTTVRMVCGLAVPDEGDVEIAGVAMRSHPSAAKRLIGYVPQDVALYPDLTARENLAFFGKLQGLRRGELAARVDAALELVGLTERARERVEPYSGGMKRRLNIAAALLHSPRLLVLDEPTVGVDPQSRTAILDNVEKLRTGGVAVLYTTHYMEEAERLCDRVGIIDAGRIVAEGTRRELVDRIGEADRIDVAGDGPLDALAAACLSVDGVRDAAVADGVLQIVAPGARHLLPRVLEAAEDARVRVTSVEIREPNLEAVFLHLTGRALRD